MFWPARGTRGIYDSHFVFPSAINAEAKVNRHSGILAVAHCKLMCIGMVPNITAHAFMFIPFTVGK